MIEYFTSRDFLIMILKMLIVFGGLMGAFAYLSLVERRVMAFVQIVCTQHSEEVTAAFERIIQASPNVLACHNTTGKQTFCCRWSPEIWTTTAALSKQCCENSRAC